MPSTTSTAAGSRRPGADRSRPYEIGEQVTVVPGEFDPYILQFQRYATVVRRDQPNLHHSATVWFYWVTLSGTMPPDQQFGPFARDQLLPGWRGADGKLRQW